MKTTLLILATAALPAALLLTGCETHETVVVHHPYHHDWGPMPVARVEIHEHPPYSEARWQPGHWVLHEHGWVWIPGHWKHHYY